MNLKQIEVFRAVMMAGSMVGGARLLRISQPAVSQVIGQLERQIGVILFKRTNGKISATPDANLLYSETERVYFGIKNLEKLAEGLRHNRYGALRVSGFPAISRQILPEIISSYCRDKLDVDVSLDSTQSRNIADLIARQEIDLALSVLPGDRDEVQATSIGNFKAVCVLHKDHPLAKRDIIYAADLEGESFISLGRNDPSRLMIDKIFDVAGINRRLQYQTTQSDIACGLVAQNAGLSIVDELTMSWYKDDRIVIRDFEPVILFQIWLLQLRNEKQSMLSIDFCRYVKDKLIYILNNLEMKFSSNN